MKNKTKELLIKNSRIYPNWEIHDLFKFLHQSSFGCEHAVTSVTAATDWITKEYKTAEKGDLFPLDGDYTRVPLSILDNGLSHETLAKLFYLSSNKEVNGIKSLFEKITVARELISEQTLPFNIDEFEKALKAWESEGFTALHHSDTFRKLYKPSYRVVANKYIPFLDLFTAIDRRLKTGNLRIAIEGGSASGKTTLSNILSEVYDCTVFHMDDFFLRPEQRTPERFSEIGGNVDRERFLSEVLIPLADGKPILYRPFDCSTMTINEEQVILPEKLVITEGAYSMHPELCGYYNLSIYLDIRSDLQKERIIKRNGVSLSERFFNDWIPMEEEYFTKTDIKNRCDMIISIDE